MLDLRSVTPGRPLVIGHRGASGDAPENTMAAFRLAEAQGADLLELDVQLTSDLVPVVIHDPTVDRTTEGHGLVSDHTLAQIKALDAGAHFGPSAAIERIPTLEELLAWASGRIPVAIEIKHDGPLYDHRVEARTVEALRRHSMLGSAILISFDHGAVLRIKRSSPDLSCGVLFACMPVEPSALALAAGADILLPHLSNLTPEMVEHAHSHNLAISPWVADEESEMLWAVSLGVDAVATNHPGRLARLMRRRE